MEGVTSRLGEGANQEEIAEAQQVVMKAQQDVIERNKMREEAKTASKEDLQAILHLRTLKQKLRDVASAADSCIHKYAGRCCDHTHCESLP